MCFIRLTFCASTLLNSLLAYLSVGEFASIRLQALKTVRDARAERAKLIGAPLPETWDIEDHITALKARLTPLKEAYTDLLNASLNAHRVMFPEARQVRSPEGLIRDLDQAENRLKKWRSSSARAGADAALQFILSWYEKIDLVKVRSLRQGSPWATDPSLIEIREDAANFMAEFANTKHLDLDAPIYSDGEETEEDEESEEDSAEDYANSGDEVDEEESPEDPASDSAKLTEQIPTESPVTPATNLTVITEQVSSDPDASESAHPSSSPVKINSEVPPSSGSAPATEPLVTKSTLTEVSVTEARAPEAPLAEAPTTEVPTTDTLMTESAATESTAP